MQTILETIQAERASLDALLAPLNAQQLCVATLDGERSIKDILAHIAAWEALCAEWIETFLHGQSPHILDVADTDDFNEQLFQEHRNRSLPEVQEYSRIAYQHLLQQVQALTQAFSEADLYAEHRFAWAEPWPGHSLVAIIAGNSFTHYREHYEEIGAWLEHPQAQ